MLVCVNVVPRQGAAGCGALTPWQAKHGIPDPPPEKSVPWQIWQEANPELPGACFAVAAVATAGVAQSGDGAVVAPGGVPEAGDPGDPAGEVRAVALRQELVPPVAM